ncbi:hypothetical protein GBAR_LOCUS16802, partial [Geodia barretti]
VGIEDFAEVQAALWAARSKWHNIGIRLKLDVRELENIDAETRFGLDDKFNLMIKTRFNKIEPCTWRDLYDALNHPTVAMSDVANRLSAKLTAYTASEAEDQGRRLEQQLRLKEEEKEAEIARLQEQMRQLATEKDRLASEKDRLASQKQREIAELRSQLQTSHKPPVQ